MQQHKTLFFSVAVWFTWFSLYTYVPILSPYINSLDASLKMIGIVMGAYGLIQTVFRLPLGIFADKYRMRSPLITVGLLFGVVSALGMAMWPNIYAAFIFRTLSGFAATVWVLQTVVYNGFYPDTHSSQAMGILTAILLCGEMLGMFAGGAVAQLWGYRAAFLLASFTAAIALFFNILVREPHVQQKSEPLRLADLVKITGDKTLNFSAVLGLILQTYTFTTAFGFTPLIAENIGANHLQIGVLSVAFMLPGMLSSSINGLLIRKTSEKSLLTVSYLIMACSCILTPFVSSVAQLFTVQIISGFFRGLAFPMIMAIGIRDVVKEKRATAMGYIQAVYGLGMFLGPMIFGIFGDLAGIRWGFIITGIITLVGSMLAQTGTIYSFSPLSQKDSIEDTHH